MGTTLSHPARIIAIPFRRDAMDEVAHIYRSTSMPLTIAGGGLVSMLGLFSRETGHSASVTVWDTAADRERSGMTPEAADNLMLYAHLMVGSYVRENYDATVNTLRACDGSDETLTYASVTTIPFEPSHWDDAVRALRVYARHATPEHPDCLGVLLLEAHVRHSVRLIAVGASREAVALYDSRTRPHVQGARVRQSLAGPPSYESFDVFGRY